MKRRYLGRTGIQVSEICLGTMTFGCQCDETTSIAILDRAAEAGVDFLDTADCYPIPMTLETQGRTEEILGRWLAGKRQKFVIATKSFFPIGPLPNDRGNSRRHLIEAVEGSLRRLRTDFIDLHQVHAYDPETSIEQTLRALDDLVRAGKIRYAGCSNFLAWEVGESLAVAERLRTIHFECVQARYNLIHRDAESDLLPLCRHRGLGVIAYNPLAGGVLTGKHVPGAEPDPTGRFGSGLGDYALMYRRRYFHQESLEAARTLAAFFDRRGRSLVTAAVAWVLGQGGVTAAIVGASRPEQLAASLAASGFALDQEEQASLDEVWYRLPRRRGASGPVR